MIAIAGNPNAGKTTLFNALTGTRQKVGNYAGVTVERKVGKLDLPSGETVDIVDLPGCYSLAARSPEEQIAHDVLLGAESKDSRRPDIVVVVIDASNLQRNLFLATQLMDLGIPLIVALNMMDIAVEKGVEVSVAELAQTLGCPIIPLVARRGEGLEQLIEALEARSCENCTCSETQRFIDCIPPVLKKPLQTLEQSLISNQLSPHDTARSEALWLLISALEGDDSIKVNPSKAALTLRVLKEYKLNTKQVRALETSARYRYLKELMAKAHAVEKDLPHRLTERLDRILLHRIFGPVIFLFVMTIIFQSIFSWATPAMDGIQQLVTYLSDSINQILPDSLFKQMLTEGVINGVGNVLVFLPQVLILFFFIGLLEDFGYMARAAFLMDRLMLKAGLDGRAFVPLLSSFACAIPGIMATRTIAAKKDRLVTILVAPLMSCSARLPVYTLIIGTVFSANQKVWGFFTVGGLVLLAMYILSIVVGVTMAAIFKHTILKSPPPPLLLELPTYKVPSLKSIGLNLYDRAKLFTIRAGTVILASTVILWGVMNWQLHPLDTSRFDQARTSITDNSSLTKQAAQEQQIQINRDEEVFRLEHSLGGRLGKLIEPVIAPLGFDWKMGVGIIASFAAREVFVSGLAVVHGVNGEDEHSPLLKEQLKKEINPATGQPVYTPLVGISLMVFFVLACQCISTVTIVYRETMSIKWPLFMISYMGVLAWVGSFAVYNCGKLFGWG